MCFKGARGHRHSVCVSLSKILEELAIFYSDLNKLIVDYDDVELIWDVNPTAVGKITNDGLTVKAHSTEYKTYRTITGWIDGCHTWNLIIDYDTPSGYMRIGFVTSKYKYNGESGILLGDHPHAPGFWSGSTLYCGGSFFTKSPHCPETCPKFKTGDTVTFCLDLENKEFFVNSKKYLISLPVSSTLIYYPAVSFETSADLQVTIQGSESY